MSQSSQPVDEKQLRMRRLILTAVVVAIVLVADLWSKQWAWDTLRPDSPGDRKAITVIEHVFYLRFGFNTGSAFSFLRDVSWARSFFITVTFAALGYMAWLAWKMPTSQRYGFLAVGLIAGGAAGNLHDRFVRVHEGSHGVIDFLQFYYWWPSRSYWPIFNVADSALVCGVILLLFYIRQYGDVTSEDPEESPATGTAAQA